MFEEFLFSNGLIPTISTATHLNQAVNLPV